MRLRQWSQVIRNILSDLGKISHFTEKPYTTFYPNKVINPTPVRLITLIHNDNKPCTRWKYIDYILPFIHVIIPRKNESVHLSFTLHQSYHTPLCLSGFREVKVARRTFTQPSPLTRMDSYLPMIRVICRIKFLGIEKWSDIVHNDNRWRCRSYV